MFKNLIFYYLCAFIPPGALMWLLKAEKIDTYIFIGVLFFYAFVYRTYIDGKRLHEKDLIPKKDIWKMIIPGSRIAFFKELYFTK